MQTLAGLRDKIQARLAALNAKTGRSDTNHDTAIKALPSKKTVDDVVASNGAVTLPAGIYFSRIQKKVPPATCDIEITVGEHIRRCGITATVLGANGIEPYRISATGGETIELYDVLCGSLVNVSCTEYFSFYGWEHSEWAILDATNRALLVPNVVDALYSIELGELDD